MMKSKFLLIVFLFCIKLLTTNAQSYSERYLNFQNQIKDSAFSLPEVTDKMNEYLKGSIAPNFTAKTLDGKKIELASLKGQVVILYFWNTRCEPCIEQIPELKGLINELSNRNVTFISLFSEHKDAVKRYFQGQVPDFNTIAESETIAVKKFKLPALFPYTIIINQHGKILKMWFGANEKNKNIANTIRLAMNEKL